LYRTCNSSVQRFRESNDNPVKRKGGSMNEERSFVSTILRIAISLVLLLILLSVFHSKCQLTSVQITNNTRAYTEEEIKEMVFTSPLDKYAVLFRIRWFLQGDQKLPFIEQIDAELTDRNSIALTVYEKRIIGCVQVMGQFFYFDRDGLVAESSSKRVEGIPLILGLEFDNIVLHKNLKVQKASLYDVILNLTRLIELYGLDVSKIVFLYDNSVVLHCGETEIRLGRHESYDTALAALDGILAELEDKSMILYMENYSEINKDITAKKK